MLVWTKEKDRLFFSIHCSWAVKAFWGLLLSERSPVRLRYVHITDPHNVQRWKQPSLWKCAKFLAEARDSGWGASSDHHPALWAQGGLVQYDQEVPDAALPLFQHREAVSMRPPAALAAYVCVKYKCVLYCALDKPMVQDSPLYKAVLTYNRGFIVKICNINCETKILVLLVSIGVR